VTSLQARDLSRRFGGLLALGGVDLDLPAGHVLGVIGPNGAGKSTLINLLSGVLRPSTGSVHIDGRDYTGARPWRIAHAGVARTFQIVKPFRGMTVLDNVTLAVLYGPARVRWPGRARRRALEVLERVGLADRAELHPAELTVAGARALELARALALRPGVLLLDEVLAGLRPGEIEPALALIRELREEGLAVLMVEHLVHAITAVSDEVLVLHHGQVLTRGAASAVLADQRVIEAYLGRRYAARAAATDAAAGTIADGDADGDAATDVGGKSG
jgi:branched-chain amino acid transport system ATP-binding protein